jgi:hypothetical protein
MKRESRAMIPAFRVIDLGILIRPAAAQNCSSAGRVMENRESKGIAPQTRPQKNSHEISFEFPKDSARL